ncbi:MAG: hypothetical protein J2P37_20775, partial [Ktedonobacteraceae bacterium]|nr:hypothetical protein [Ktedonobacteraceae bacterium]
MSSRLSFIFRQPTMLAHLLLRSQAVGKEFPTRGGPTFPARQGDAEGASITAWEGIWQKRGYETLGAGLLIMLAVALRVLLIARGWPLLDSDEGTMGIMAIHIDRLGEHPFFFYGQAYMGATEAYLAAFFFHFFGVSTFSLRLGLVLIYVVFLVAMFFLTRMVYSGRFALVVLLLLALGSNAMLVRELVAVGGDPETLMSSALVMCLASWLALTAEERGRARPG